MLIKRTAKDEIVEFVSTIVVDALYVWAVHTLTQSFHPLTWPQSISVIILSIFVLRGLRKQEDD